MAEQEKQINDGSVISVILPTRGRVKSGALQKSIESLLDNAKNNNNATSNNNNNIPNNKSMHPVRTSGEVRNNKKKKIFLL